MARLLAKNRDARLPNAEVALQQLQSLLDSGVFGAEPLAPVGATAPPPPPVAHDEYDEEYYETEEPIAAAAAAAAAGQGHIVRIGANDSTTVLPGAPPYRYDQRRQTPWVLWAGLALVVLVIILVVVALSGGGGGTSTVTVPVVLNKTQDDAIAALTKAGLNAKTVSIPNDTVAAGIVYASDPGAGQKVAKHSTVSLSVRPAHDHYASSGHDHQTAGHDDRADGAADDDSAGDDHDGELDAACHLAAIPSISGWCCRFGAPPFVVVVN